MNIETWAEIRRLGHIEKLSTSAIAQRMNLSRPTVRHALARPHFQAVTHNRRSKLDPFKGHIEAILREYPELSSVRLFEKLRALGYAGHSSILRAYVATLRPLLRPVFTRVIVRPGERFEVDWAHCGDWPVEGGTRPLSCFVMVLSFSRMLFLEFVLSQKMELFLAGHQHAILPASTVSSLWSATRLAGLLPPWLISTFRLVGQQLVAEHARCWDRHIHDILALVRLYGKTEVCQALAQALGHGAFGSDYIRNLVIAARRRRRGPAPSPPLHLTHHPELLDLGVDEVDLSGYDIEDSEESDP